jgi:hypothetical protein
MRESSAVRAALLAMAVVVLVFAVALGSSRSLARVGGPGRVLKGQLTAGDLSVAFSVLALAGLAGLVYALWGGRRRKRRDDEPEWVAEQLPVPWWGKPLALALALLPVAGLVTALVILAGHGRRTGPARTVAPAVTAPHRAAHPGPSVPGPASGPAAVHWWVWAVLAGAVVAAAVIAVVRRRLGRARNGSARAAVPRVLPAVIEESLEELEREGDPRRAVIRAYVGMEAALARHGFGRRPFEAPQEFLARALGAIRLSRPAAERLTGLFQRARFSEHPIAAQMKQDAITALVTVRDELAEQRQ